MPPIYSTNYGGRVICLFAKHPACRDRQGARRREHLTQMQTCIERKLFEARKAETEAQKRQDAEKAKAAEKAARQAALRPNARNSVRIGRHPSGNPFT